MKLYGSYTSPFVRHCRVLLETSGLGWTFIETDGAQSGSLSPAKKVPFLHDDGVMLTDSTSIVRYIREQLNQPFMASVAEFDDWLLLNTAFDATINLFLLERSGLAIDDNAYLRRQNERIHSCLAVINEWPLDGDLLASDLLLRLACYLDWVVYRERADLSNYANLRNWLESVRGLPVFSQTHPSLLADA